MKLPPFEYECPSTVAEAVAILARHGDAARPLAGGQSLMPMMAFRLATPSMLVDLNGVAGLGAIEFTPDGILIGALVRWRDLEESRRLALAHPLLAEAIRHIAHYQIRNRGTVGGSLANADPAAELPGIAVTCDAEIQVEGAGGSRTIPAADFLIGAMVTSLGPDEIITGVRFPIWPSTRRWAFLEFARHKGDFALAGIALHYDPAPDGTATNVRIGVIGASSRPCRLSTAEAKVEGQKPDPSVIAQACAAAKAEIDPPVDIHASQAYRRALTATLLERCFERAANR